MRIFWRKISRKYYFVLRQYVVIFPTALCSGKNGHSTALSISLFQLSEVKITSVRLEMANDSYSGGYSQSINICSSIDISNCCEVEFGDTYTGGDYTRSVSAYCEGVSLDIDNPPLVSRTYIIRD